VEPSTQLREYGQPAPDHTPDAEGQAGLYAFGILDGAELARFERHLSACGRCAEVVDGDQAIVSTLGLMAPDAEPSPGFKEQVLARAAAEAAARPDSHGGDASASDPRTGGVGGAPGVVAPAPFRARRVSRTPLTWLVPLAAMLIALLAGTGLLSRQIASEQLIPVATLANQADRGRADLLVRRSTGEGVIRLTGFDDLGNGQVYQSWVIRPGSQPVPTGASPSGTGTLALDGDVRGAKVAVTLEPGPGAKAPSQQPFVIGDAPA
jgi:anti-sigma-K factor RskA